MTRCLRRDGMNSRRQTGDILPVADPIERKKEWNATADLDYSAATYGYARQYSGVNLGSFVKHITSSNLTAEGLVNVSEAVMQLAKVEELEAHRRAVSIRLEHMRR